MHLWNTPTALARVDHRHARFAPRVNAVGIQPSDHGGRDGAGLAGNLKGWGRKQGEGSSVEQLRLLPPDEANYAKDQHPDSGGIER